MRIPVNATNTPRDADALFRITQPGSYFLTGSVTGVSGKNGIRITTDRVTLDLNGISVSGAFGSLDGILAGNELSPRVDVIVRNGIVSGWGADGVSLENAVFSANQGVNATFNGGEGVHIGTGAASNAAPHSRMPRGWPPTAEARSPDPWPAATPVTASRPRTP